MHRQLLTIIRLESRELIARLARLTVGCPVEFSRLSPENLVRPLHFARLGRIGFRCDNPSRASKLQAARLGRRLNPQRHIPREVGQVQRTI